MAHDKDHEDTLPFTAELGDEGGSYGDATAQAETFAGAGGNARVDPKRTGAGRRAGADAAASTPADAPPDTVRHAAEPPPRKG